MGLSIIQEQHHVIIETLQKITQDDWKVLVLDETSKKVVDNVVKEDDILNKNIANIERIEERREMNPTMDAIYLLSPQSHIVDCLLADLGRRRYRRAFLVWTALPEAPLQKRLDSDPAARRQIAGVETLPLDFFPRESHLVTFRDPWSFPILYHPDCNGMVRKHMEILSQKIASVCIAAGENPKVRFFRPKNAQHEASVLCTHLARFVQDHLDQYARWNRDFPPPSSRPPSVLVVTDRAMDLMAPLVHEFTYQAMAHDLLAIKDGDKTTYRMESSDGTDGEPKDMELHEKDEVWVDNRHRHMKDTIDKLMDDFQKFLAQNPQFTNEDGGQNTNLNVIKDMLAGLSQFTEMKEAYSLHLTMAQECMNKFQHHKLPDVASAEQTLATGLDEDGRKPRGLLDQIVRLLDDDAITKEDRLRLIMLYALYRNGIIADDVHRLLAHAALPTNLFDTVVNLELLGGHPIRSGLKETVQAPAPLFATTTDPKPPAEEDFALSRFQPALRKMLDHLCRGQLDPLVFPYVNPPLDPNEDAQMAHSASLRAAKPNWAWAGANRRVPDNRQRIFVFVAGGATYSEARACYEASACYNKDIVLATSHMLTPHLFCRQVGDLSANPRVLDIPLARPKPKAPAHLFEHDPPPRVAPPPAQGQRPIPGNGGSGGIPGGPRPPTKQLGQMTLNSGGGGRLPPPPPPPPPPAAAAAAAGNAYNASSAVANDPKAGKLHKKRNLFGLKK